MNISCSDCSWKGLLRVLWHGDGAHASTRCSLRWVREERIVDVERMRTSQRRESWCSKMMGRVWINTSDIILVGLRDYQDNKADVILKYNADEARSLKAYGELPEHAKINETDTFGPGDDEDIQFDDIGDDDEDIDDI
ncbi:eukaryotic translation initiation factor 1A, Y-chromosomal-like isoform X3 [Oncorhynchus tshawytscha]|uniref:S1-like domain-containing protein n=1 Tax=Oncorhynchus tshawytscha TaxID=74940 RepID=A0AAZ3NUK7_ONCTS|nr:eukaryotic translation initiation factor 1A, Y-chromosomal-like isoform X3 [Oncorhynchus tshawytscha]